MKTKNIWLKKGQMVDGTLFSVQEEDGFIEVVFLCQRKFRLEHHIESVEGKSLKKGITEDMIGKRVGVYNYGEGGEPIRIAVREEKQGQ